jgi:hypothetical protein
MKPVSVPTTLAPTPRLTLWVPVALSLGLCVFWLLLVAVINR